MNFTSQVPFNFKEAVFVSDYLAKRFTYLTRYQWIVHIREGRVLRNEAVVSEQDKVSPGDTICYVAEDIPEPPANLNYSIVYEDEWFLGINKPGNLLVHRAGRSFTNNLIHLLRHVHIPPFPNAHTAHRIDRDTSGVVIVAKNTAARAELQLQFSAKSIEKEYIAIVYGIPESSLQVIDKPIGKQETSAIHYKFGIDPSGKPAVTRIERVEPIGKAFSILNIRPLTGRTHQIRIHLASVGYPIIGDKLYGLSEQAYLKWRDEPGTRNDSQLLFYRHALHCASLTFRHPYKNEPCRVEAPLPDDTR
jgi:23S rRNA pseudouridine1911/1915/1917 synthase